MWLDSHCHLTAGGYDEDREQVIERAFRSGVEALIAIGSGYGPAGNDRAVALARGDPRIFATVGVHPHEAQTQSDELRSQLRAWLADPRVVAVGECGLDYHYMRSPREVQRRVLAEQLRWARELNLPVVVHVRDDGEGAYEELLELWAHEGEGTLTGVLHCFTGTLEFAKRALEQGFYISFSGVVTFRQSHALRQVAKALPTDRLLVETDAPFLAPQGHRGRRNEPAWVSLVGETLGRLHGVRTEEMARITTANARRLFRLPGAASDRERTPSAPAPEGARRS